MGHLSRITYPPPPLINVGKYRVSSNKKGKKSPDYQHCKWGEGRACSLSRPFCSGLSKKKIKECHTTCCNRVPEWQGVYRLVRTRNAHCKQRKQKNGSKSSKQNPRGYLLTSLVYGGPQLSRQNLFTHGKINFATAKSTSSQQNQFRRGKINFITAKSISPQQNQFHKRKINLATAKSILHTAQTISQYGKINFTHRKISFTQDKIIFTHSKINFTTAKSF